MGQNLSDQIVFQFLKLFGKENFQDGSQQFGSGAGNLQDSGQAHFNGE